jgi:signal peptidase II
MGRGTCRGGVMALRTLFEEPAQRLGLVAAAVVVVIDQAVKLWLLFGFDLAERGRVALTPFMDIVLARNPGISFGMFQQTGPLGQWALFVLKTIAVALLAVWLVRTVSRLSGLALGLIIGGAIGNAIDRLLHGYVLDFVLFHLSGAGWTFEWYVFNLADAAIVAGVIGLLYESLFVRTAAKAP